MTKFARCFLSLAIMALLLKAPACAADPALKALSDEIMAATTSEDRSGFERKFEPDLAAKIRTANDGPDGVVLDFDFMTNSQDPDYSGIEMTIESRIEEKSSGEAVIRVVFEQFNNRSEVDYYVRKGHGGWRIHDVTLPQINFALRQTLGMK